MFLTRRESNFMLFHSVFQPDATGIGSGAMMHSITDAAGGKLFQSFFHAIECSDSGMWGMCNQTADTGAL